MVDFTKELILKGRKCQYCKKDTHFINSKEVYGYDFGMLYICRPCDAYVGVHEGTRESKGSVAQKDLREARKLAHSWLDPMWKRKMMKDGVGRQQARRLAYNWLSQKLQISTRLCHIGMFDIDTCKKVVELCKPYYKRLRHS